MKHKAIIVALATLTTPLFAANNEQLQREIQRLQQQTVALQAQLNRLQKQVVEKPAPVNKVKKPLKAVKPAQTKPEKALPKPVKVVSSPKHAPPKPFHDSLLTVHAIDGDPDSIGFYPTALIADGHVVTYIAGTPVVTSPYLGDRPAFDGSDYIVNISSINRDIRLMQQRRRLYRAYESIGYPVPHMPIIAISGKSEPVAMWNKPYFGNSTGDINLGSSELDVAAALNDKVEAFIAIAYDDAPPSLGGPRVANSAFDLNMGFVNIGNLDQSPIYFTAGQLFVPFGRYSSAMVSAPLPLLLARTKARPFILGYKAQEDSGPYLAVYGFRSDTTEGHAAVGGANGGYNFKFADASGEIGVSYIGTLADATGMQFTGSAPFTTFGGFGSLTNGSEAVGKVPGLGAHVSISFDRYNLTAEWVGATKRFAPEDLSFNGRGARPEATQLEAGVTFIAFDKPASIAVGYQWSTETLALNIPKKRALGVFNISMWKDTVESLEYRHDTDFRSNQFANGIPAPGFINANTIGTGRVSDTVIAQIGVYF